MQDTHQQQNPGARNQRGNILVGLSIAMLAAGIIAVGSAKVAVNTFKDSTGTVIGNQLQVVSTGLSSYVAANSAALISGAAVTGVAAPLAPTVPELISLKYLNSGVTITPTVGGSYKLGVSVTPSGCTTNCQVLGSVYLTNPIYTGDNSATDVRLLGAAMAASKSSQIGFSQPASPSSITGPGWVYANPDPAQRPGILYATTFSAASSSTATTSTLYWLQSVANINSLPATGNTLGDGRLARNTGKPFMWTGTAWQELSNTDSLNMVSIGTNSGKSGLYSSYFGQGAGQFSTGGVSNTFVGFNTGLNTSGGNNTFTGAVSGSLTTSGINNTFSGSNSGYSNTSGSFNVFTGMNAGYSNTTGSGHVFTGMDAGYSNTTSFNNVFTGWKAGSSNTTGSNNVFTGMNAGYSNTTGDANVFTGMYAGYSNTTGDANVFTGKDAGRSNTTGTENAFTGTMSGYSNTKGRQNVFTGNIAGYSNTWGESNTFTGFRAGQFNTTGTGNVFTGTYAGSDNSTGNYNVFMGTNAGLSNTTGTGNVFTGSAAGVNNSTGNNNVFTGRSAGSSNTTGSDNVFIGYKAGGFNTTGSNNTFLGVSSGWLANDFTNATVIGFDVQPTASNTVRIGNKSITQIGGQVAWSNLSDRRLKTDIKDSSYGMDFVRKLRAVDYTLKDNQKHETGFIAQEVEGIDASFPGLNKPASDKDFYSLTYTDFIPPMVKAIQELDARTSTSAAAGLQNKVSILSWATALLGALVLLLGGCVVVLWSRLNEVIANQRSAAS